MQDRSNTAKAGVVIGTTAAIAAAIALLQGRKARAAEPGQIVGLDEATMKLLIAIAEAAGSTEDEVKNLANLITRLSIQVQGYPPNTETLIATRVLIAAVNTPYQLPDIAVPDDMSLQIKGWPTNAGIIRVGNSRATCINPNQSWPLLANEAIGYRVKNASAIYVSGTVAGDFAALTVEQRGRGK